MSLEAKFAPFRRGIIGIDQTFESPFGVQKILYADWTASGRLYQPIEKIFQNEIYPSVGNTHTESSFTGTAMTQAYHQALNIIKNHVHASPTEDAIICYGTGVTGVINKLQRLLGLRVHEKFREKILPPTGERAVVFVTHMEHHSNQTSWLECLADICIVEPNKEGLVDLEKFRNKVSEFKNRPLKIASITACSNVTGIVTPYHEIAEIMHESGGFCFVDFAASAPYVKIDMHPDGKPKQKLDAIFFSPHKFLGGPGSSGVMVFNKALYSNRVPDNPGGGTVLWTNPWGEHAYVDDIEAREDGGTPGFLQCIRTALCIQLKEKMGVADILKREEELLTLVWNGLKKVENLHLLAKNQPHRLGIIPFYIEGLHYNLAVRLLNDRFGIQARGGCSCAGTYGHYLLEVSYETSKSITNKIDHGDLGDKPGWIRISLHPTLTDDEAHRIVFAVQELAKNHKIWAQDYDYLPDRNEFFHKRFKSVDSHKTSAILKCFEVDL